MATCEIPDCGNPVRNKARGLCSRHYRRWQRHGDPLAGRRSPQPGRICEIKNCDKPTRERDWCTKHYQRWMKYGDAAVVLSKDLTPEQRFLTRTDKTEGCWYYTGPLSDNGYGLWSTSRNGGNKQAHRVAYELFVGPIPEGLDVDHLCHNRDQTCPGGKDCFHRSCVRPDHLEPCTRQDNLFRSHRFHANLTHCPQGHPYTPENTQWWNDTRKCRTCHAARERDRRARQREQEGLVHRHELRRD